ncbi:MerR family transcriptional regulator [Streptomyces sp. NPDC090022]|uniref:MerR family transcriptional regulator n=1 Tax=Streptomyces sp. NPDC090022 TaxID=3365920 RepID=UPI003818DD02
MTEPAAPAVPAVPALTTGAVARRLGVAPTTLRSWERRYAIGPAEREGGRHRRWTAGDIARLELMCRLTAQGVPPREAARAALDAVPEATVAVPEATVTRPRSAAEPGIAQPHADDPDARDPGDARRERRGLARAAVRLDAPAVEELVAAAFAGRGLVAGWEQVVAPTLHAVGRRWATVGESYVEVEHLLSWHVSSALHRLRPVAGAARTPPVLVACVPGEQHSLPVEALTAALGERDVPALMFGAALPVAALHDAVRRTGPRAVVLWSQTRATADPALLASLSAVAWGPRGARGRPALLLAGPGWGSAPLPPGARRLHALGSALAVVEALVTTPVPVGSAR